MTLESRDSGGPGASRLAQAQAALARAESRAGLRVARALEVAQGPGRRAGVRGAALRPGVTRLTGSTTVLLALAAQAQAQGWCALVGAEGLGWCAAAEEGLDLGRVVLVRPGEADRRGLLAVLGALLEAVGTVLVTAEVAARLRPADRRALLARAREREARLLTDGDWEGARAFRAHRLNPLPHAGLGGVVVPLRGRPAPQELPAGRLVACAWEVRETTGWGQVEVLRRDSDGVSWETGVPQSCATSAPAARARTQVVG